jgi:hypothetical protein
VGLRRIFSLLCALLLGGCEIFEPTVEVPAYLEVLGYNFNADEITEGTSSENITTCYVYLNNSQLGVFEYPIEIPLLAEGKNNLQIYAGINNNGLSATKEIYPFYTVFQNDTSFDLVRGKTFPVTPSFKYKTSTKFVWMEDFERSSITLEETPSSASNIDIIQYDIFGNGDEGFQSGKVDVDHASPYTEILSVEEFKLERNGLKVYLELNFKGSQSFNVELWSNNVDGSIYKDNVVGLIPVEDKWKKIYIDLTEYVNRNTQAESYQIAFVCNPTTISESTYFSIDNIKLLAF